MSLFYSSVSVSHDSVTVNLHAQHIDPETEVGKWNSTIIFICAFPTVACQNVFYTESHIYSEEWKDRYLSLLFIFQLCENV